MKNVSYLTDHYDEKIKKIKEINAPLNFVFITDEHNRIGESFLEDNGGVYELRRTQFRPYSIFLTAARR